jgi:hypothetical protein
MYSKRLTRVFASIFLRTIAPVAVLVVGQKSALTHSKDFCDFGGLGLFKRRRLNVGQEAGPHSLHAEDDRSQHPGYTGHSLSIPNCKQDAKRHACVTQSRLPSEEGRAHSSETTEPFRLKVPIRLKLDELFPRVPIHITVRRLGPRGSKLKRRVLRHKFTIQNPHENSSHRDFQ